MKLYSWRTFCSEWKSIKNSQSDNPSKELHDKYHDFVYEIQFLFFFSLSFCFRFISLLLSKNKYLLLCAYGWWKENKTSKLYNIYFLYFTQTSLLLHTTQNIRILREIVSSQSNYKTYNYYFYVLHKLLSQTSEWK